VITAKQRRRVEELLDRGERTNLIARQVPGVSERTVRRIRLERSAEKTSTAVSTAQKPRSGAASRGQYSVDPGRTPASQFGHEMPVLEPNPESTKKSPAAVLHDCGERVRIATRGCRKRGIGKGDALPCSCQLCAPVEVRQGEWFVWKTQHHAGFYMCHRCAQIVFTAGRDLNKMWCRSCFRLPPNGQA
jgi:hypothetical protein